ncbi:MAG TPA: hypothetical protein VG963_13985 [Polyangiaceae bacterium]|nr:hypothetical protein [Polyangiaceae bacterium]
MKKLDNETNGTPSDSNQLSVERREFLERTAAAGAAAVGAVAMAALGCKTEAQAQTTGSQAQAQQAGGDAQAPQAGKTVNTTHDWMLFTDKSRTGGVLCTGTSSLVVTSAFVQGLEATYFNTAWTTAPTTADIRSKATGLEGTGPASADQLDQAVGEFVSATGVFTLGSTAQTLATPTSSVDRTPGQLMLNGKTVWRPGGQIMTRLAGSSTLTFVVGPQDLRGTLTPSTNLGAVGLIAGRPGITAAGSGCGACGTCSVCGLCTLCAEVNAGAAGAASTAALAVTNLSSVSFSPTALDPITNTFPPGVSDFQLATTDLTNSLARFTAAAANVRGG